MGGMSASDINKADKAGSGAKSAREARLAQALRANLKRRKQAGRGQAAADGPDGGMGEES
jgi:hypothetical protein